jgi:outer membrane protein assembly factor BamE (lipoprotein component of BamABCDE complex)
LLTFKVYIFMNLLAVSRKSSLFINTLLSIVLLSGCMTAAEHSASLHSAADQKMTVGLVQAKITKGMSQGQVAEILGSPNIVSKDQAGNDTWIFDKIASEASFSKDQGGGGGGVGAGIEAGNALILGGLLGNYNRSAGASATTQRTLTVVIKFDSRQLVNDFSYHSTQF